jgi:hypothetical protein
MGLVDYQYVDRVRRPRVGGCQVADLDPCFVMSAGDEAPFEFFRPLLVELNWGEDEDAALAMMVKELAD